MVSRLSVLSLALAAGLSSVSALTTVERRAAIDTCKTIKTKVSASTKVYYPGSTQYDTDIHHFSPSNSESAACAVEPATPADVGEILKVVAKDQTQFAVWSGGHAMNPKFSSTTGVQISLVQFNGTSFDSKTNTVVIGSGQPWTAVFKALEPFGVSVPGVRVPNVAVGGYTLGGGFAFTTSEVGLGFDSVLSFELVKPDGSVVTASAKQNPDLFFALKGGATNFGVVTRFTMQTYPQGPVYGGNIIVGADQFDAVAKAMAEFDKLNTEKKDKKAAVNSIFQHTREGGAGALVNIFYNAPTPPDGLFDAFASLTPVSGSVKTRTLLSLVEDIAFPFTPRTIWDSVPVEKYPLELTQEFVKENNDLTTLFENTSWNFIFHLVECFTPDYLSRAPALAGFATPSAWPPQRNVALMPSLIWAGWNDTKDDALIQKAVQDSSVRLRTKAASLGQAAAAVGSSNSSKYPNYSAFWTTPEEIFGNNLPVLKQIKQKHDPKNVMALTGGFKI